MPERLLSGIKPTGNIHIGNYFGAMRQFLELQDQYESFLFIADLHALNQIHNPEELADNIREIAKAYLAIGLDPDKVTLFQQSRVPAHTQLTWIFNSITSMGLLERAHAYKDALANERSVNVGLFDYPVLMAADILLYHPKVVPVGNDQQQHVEIAVDIAQRFHHLYGPTFTIPQPLIRSEVAVVPGLDGRKMSKSYHNVIGLFDTPEATVKKVMAITTDSKGLSEPKDPETCTIFALHKLFSTDQIEELRERYRSGSITYKESKERLAERINAFLQPIRERKAELDSQPEYIERVLAEGSAKASEMAEKTLREVMERVGLSASHHG
ncbi:tryptophan--tRNA ligase [Patescibacteria group bacterium]|nr:tryptophan--tRNA ligase [Patescibacteria group bacterium]